MLGKYVETEQREQQLFCCEPRGRRLTNFNSPSSVSWVYKYIPCPASFLLCVAM